MRDESFWRGFRFAMGGLVLTLAVVVATQTLKTGHYHSNETPTIATLRNLASVQSEFQDSCAVDLDGDGIGEYGTFEEMTGAGGLRVDPPGRARGLPLQKPLLSVAMANAGIDGIVRRSGYAYRIFLPAKVGGAAHEGRAGFKDPYDHPLDTDAAEKAWCAYAWPVASGTSSTRVFFVCQRGDVWQTANADGRYAGPLAAPAWDAAMPRDGKEGWSPTPGAGVYTGRDGSVWKPTN